MREQADRVGEAIAKIEELHGKEAIDQHCWQNHTAGTRAHDAVTILEWLEDHGETYTRTLFNKFLDRIVTKRWIEYHIMNPAHEHDMELETEDANKEKVMKKFTAYSLVHQEWPILPLHCYNCCKRGTIVQRYGYHIRPVDGTDKSSRPWDDNPVPWTGRRLF